MNYMNSAVLVAIFCFMTCCRSADVTQESLLKQWNDRTTSSMPIECSVNQVPLFVSKLESIVRPAVVEYIYRNNLQDRIDYVAESSDILYDDETIATVIRMRDGYYARLVYNVREGRYFVNFGESTDTQFPKELCTLGESINHKKMTILSEFDGFIFHKVAFMVY